MGKAVLMSIQPKWCELIASCKKTVEVRKTKPKLDAHFKVYIYQTKKTWVYNIFSKIADWQGKVIGEFVCDKIDEYTNYSLEQQYGHTLRREKLLRSACMTLRDWYNYIGTDISDYGYVWHISNLVIYDKPKGLSEFRGNPCNAVLDIHESCTNCGKCGLKRPPQSWMYVEELSV